MTTDDQHQCAYKDALLVVQAELAALVQRQKEQEEQLAKLRHEHDVLLRQHFGKRSEKMAPPKDELRKRGDIAKQTPEERIKAREEGRAWKGDLDTEEVREALPEAPAACEQCHTVPDHPLPDRVSYSYDLKPARIVCRKHVQPQVRCDCGSTIVTAPAPLRLYGIPPTNDASRRTVTPGYPRASRPFCRARQSWRDIVPVLNGSSWSRRTATAVLA